MDVLTDSSLTLIVKTSEPENANVVENTGEKFSLFFSDVQPMNVTFIKLIFFLNEKKLLSLPSNSLNCALNI